MSEELYFNKRMVRLGEILNEISKWIWLTIFFFWLLFPVIVLAFCVIRVLIVMNDLRMIQEEDAHLERAIGYFLVFPFGLILVGGILASRNIWFVLIGYIVGMLLLYMGCKEVCLWSENLLKSMPPLQDFHEGMKTARTGSFLLIILIGLFVIPFGLAKAGKNLLAVFGSNQNAVPYMQQMVPTQPVQPVQNTQPSSVYPQTPSIGIATERIGVSPNTNPFSVSTHCPKCHAQFPQPGAKFCGACGFRVN